MGNEDLNIPLTLTISLAAALGGTVAKKFYTDKEPTGLSGGFVFNAVGSLAAAVVLLCWGGFGATSAFTILLGLLFGAIVAFQGITNIAAQQVGPMSYTSVIISFSTLLSALSGVLFFSESLGWAQIVGIVLMLASFVLATEKDSDDKKKANLKWFLLCIAAFFATGGIGIMQKVHQSSSHRGELNSFLIIAFISSALLCAICAVITRRRERKARSDTDGETANPKRAWLMLAIMLIGGVCIAINHKLNLYLSGVMESAVFFPIVNGVGLILATLAAVILFRERLTKKQWVGIVLGITSVVFLCNPFG